MIKYPQMTKKSKCSCVQCFKSEQKHWIMCFSVNLETYGYCRLGIGYLVDQQMEIKSMRAFSNFYSVESALAYKQSIFEFCLHRK